MSKYYVNIVCLFILITSCSQTAERGPDKNTEMLIGKWKAVVLRLTDENDSKNIIRIDLTDPNSIKYFSDTVFYDGLYRKVKVESDTSLEAKKVALEVSTLFEDMDRTYITFKADSTYSLNNQQTLFGFEANGTVFKTLAGLKYFLVESRIFKGQKAIGFNIAKGDDRGFAVIKLTNDTLIIDEEWREINGPPLKEITFVKQ
jgi:hypothetical protein